MRSATGQRTPAEVRRPRILSKLTAVILLAAFTTANAATGFLHTRGQDIVDEQGEKVLLRGVGLGNWLLPEGYMWKFGEKGDRPRKIEALVSELIGPENAARFWQGFRRHYITEADIERIASLGYNCVRPALNARLFLTETEPPTYVESGFELLDNLIAWCRKHRIYVIIDMHGAPGGQTGANIDDSPDDRPLLFEDKKYEARLVGLWVKLASRYKDEPFVAAYDLLNEPLPARTGAAAKHKDQLLPLYRLLTTAIRRVDARHMITLEGADWANDWSMFSKPFDSNVFYQFHYYAWDRPDNLKGVDQFISHRAKLGAPIWVGETGEKDNAIYWGSLDYFEANNIGWSFWPWKKMDTLNTPCSINLPEGWSEIVQYSKGGPKPSAAVAQKAFDQLLENIKIEKCRFHPEVVNAMFRRIPGKVEAENYGHDGADKSYHVKDRAQRAAHYRKSEPVTIEPVKEEGWRSEQAIKLKPDEWTAYTINSLDAASYSGKVRVKAASGPPVELQITLGDAAPVQKLAAVSSEWAELPLQPIRFAKGANRLTLRVIRGELLVDWLEFRLQQ
jgi:aryl-phospho-beta-D-glucosidase BglC (GH1 family)